MVVLETELVVGRLAVEVQVAAHAGRTGVDAAHRDLDGARRREDPRQIVPLQVREVVAVDRVQPLELRHVLEQADAALERRRASRRATPPSHCARRPRRPRVDRRARRHGILVVERHDERLRIRLVGDGRRPIRRQLRRRPGVRNRFLAPARLVRRVHRREEVMAANLPDAALFDVLVLEHAQAPVRVLAVHGFLREHVPAAVRRQAVGRDVHDRLQLHVIEQALRLRRLGAVQQQELANAVAAHVDAAAADLDRCRRPRTGRRLRTRAACPCRSRRCAAAS